MPERDAYLDNKGKSSAVSCGSFNVGCKERTILHFYQTCPVKATSAEHVYFTKDIMTAGMC